MKSQTLKIMVPGKLFIAGEYAVLEPGNIAVVIAVNRFMNGEIKTSLTNVLSLPDIGFDHVTWSYQNGIPHFDRKHPRLKFVQNAMMICHQFLKEKGIPPFPFALSIKSELDDVSGRKLGLGSSAAIVVTVVSAVMNFYKQAGLEVSKELIYKLASIAHYSTQGNGSCADIAASTYGGWIKYSTFNSDWLKKELRTSDSVSAIVHKDWPHFVVENLEPPQFLELCVGWTGDEAKTAPLVKRIQGQMSQNPDGYRNFLDSSREAVTNLIASFENNDRIAAVSSLKECRLVLKHLGESTSVPIETNKLARFIRIAEKYGYGKSSGAGGGDCGIAFVLNKEDIPRLQQEWKEAGIDPLDIQVSEQGAVVLPA